MVKLVGITLIWCQGVFFFQHIFSHFLLDLYSLTGYIHNQLAIDFPPAIVHPKISCINTIGSRFILGRAVSHLVEGIGRSPLFGGMKRGITTVLSEETIHLTSL